MKATVDDCSSKYERQTVDLGFENQTVRTKVKTMGRMTDFMDHDSATGSETTGVQVVFAALPILLLGIFLGTTQTQLVMQN